MSEMATFIERNMVVCFSLKQPLVAWTPLCGRNQQVHTSLPPVAARHFVRLVNYWEFEEGTLLFWPRLLCRDRWCWPPLTRFLLLRHTFTSRPNFWTLFQQRISCLPIGASGSRHTNVSLLLSVTITVILSQLGLFGWTWRFFSCPLTPRCVSGHLHLPGTNVPSDCLAVISK